MTGRLRWTAAPIDEPRLFAAQHRCIYCGATGVELTDEHTLPDGLGGAQILPKASCRPCQKLINEEVEQYCQRILLGSARLRFGMKAKKRSRRKRPSPPMTFTVTHKDGRKERIVADGKHFPIVLVLPMLPYPTILDDLPPPKKFMGSNWIFDQSRLHKLVRESNLLSITTQAIKPNILARFVAKIAHAQATAVLGDIFAPLLPDLILGKRKGWIELVGGEEGELRPSEAIGHRIAMYPVRRDDGVMFVMAEVRFFAFLGSPTFLAVLGPQVKDWPAEHTYQLSAEELRNLHTTGALPDPAKPMGRPGDRPLLKLP